MRWFHHDSDASLDPKLMKLRIRYGMAGYGLYWYCLERIANSLSEHKFTFELEHDAELISHETGLHIDEVNSIMNFMVDLGLFENSRGVITCLKMAKRLDQSMTSSRKMRGMIAKFKSENHDPIMTNHDSVMTLSCKNRREENIYIEANASNFGFDDFWSKYPKKKNKGQAVKAWNKLNPDDGLVTDILSGIDRAKRSEDWQKQGGQFIPYPATWINAQGWLDELPEDQADSFVPGKPNARVS